MKSDFVGLWTDLIPLKTQFSILPKAKALDFTVRQHDFTFLCNVIVVCDIIIYRNEVVTTAESKLSCLVYKSIASSPLVCYTKRKVQPVTDWAALYG